MNSEQYRPLSSLEQKAIAAMLGVDFPGRTELLGQVSDLLISMMDEGLYKLSSASAGNVGLKTFPLPIECTYLDEDGAIVYVDLFVDEHEKLAELELWRPDGKPILLNFAQASLSIKPAEVHRSK
jgi:hypothetical protein